jgi:hypothetical protein
LRTTVVPDSNVTMFSHVAGAGAATAVAALEEQLVLTVAAIKPGLAPFLTDNRAVGLETALALFCGGPVGGLPCLNVSPVFWRLIGRPLGSAGPRLGCGGPAGTTTRPGYQPPVCGR